MANIGRGTGLNFTANISIDEAKRNVAELKKVLADLRISSAAKLTGGTFDNKGLTGYQQAQLALKKTLIDAQAESQRLRNENLQLAASYKQGQLSAQQFAAAERQNRKDRLALAEASRVARQSQQAANGSYDEANNRLKALGRSIKAAEGGFTSTNPAIKAQVAEYNKLNDALKKFDEKLGNHQRKVADYPNGIAGVTGELKSLAAGYLSIQALVSGVTATFNSALQIDAVKTSLAYTLQSSIAAENKLQDLEKTADRLGLSFLPLADSYASFAGAAKASNFPLTETNRIFNAIAGSGARMHLTTDQISGSLLAVQQMISKGTVQSEELRGQLGERLPGAFAIAAKAMGVTEIELGKLLQSGQVLASDLLPKLATQLEDTFKTNENIDSLQASLNKLSSTLDESVSKESNISSFFKAIVDGATGALRTVTSFVNSKSWQELIGRVGSAKRGDVIRGYRVATDMLETDTMTGKDIKSDKQAVARVEELNNALNTARNTYSEFRKAVKAGTVTESDDLSLKTLGATIDGLKTAIEIYKQDFPKAFAAAIVVAKKGSQELRDDQLTSIMEIKKRIADLSAKPGSAIEGSDIDIRIDRLKERLKAKKSIDESELKARDALQKKFDDNHAQALKKQETADQQELTGVRLKYAALRNEAEKFNNDPRNKAKGYRVDGSKLNADETLETNQVKAGHAVEALKLQTDQQKVIFKDFEDYRAKTSEETALKIYGAQVGGTRSYLDYLKSLQPTIEQLNSSDGEIRAKAVRVKEFLDERIAAEVIANKKRDDEVYANAYQAAMTNAQAILGIESDYQTKVKALGDSATAEQIANLKRQRDERIRSENEANADQEAGYFEVLQHLDEMTKGQAIKALENEKTSYTKQYQNKLITAEFYLDRIAQINAKEDEITGHSVFNGISRSIKRYKDAKTAFDKATDKSKGSDESIAVEKARADVYKEIADGAEAASVAISGMADIFDQLGIGGDKLQDTLKGVSGVLSGAGDIAKGIASDDPVAVVTGSIKLLSSAISLFNTKDKNLQKKIDGYQRQLAALGESYKDLDRAVKNAVGNDIYADQAAQIENLKQQQAKLIQMRNAEADKKKTDQGKIDDYNNQIADIPRQIDDINQAISQNLIQGTFRELSNSLADALTSAFQAGEDGIAAMDKSLDQFIANAIKNSLKLAFFDKDVKRFTDDLTAYAKAHENSVVGFDFASWKEIFKNDADNFNAGLEASKDIFKAGSANNSPTTAAGRISASITEDTATRLYGVFAGTQLATVQIKDLMVVQGKTMGELYRLAVDHLNVAVKIEKNTGRTADTLDTHLPEMNATMKALLKNSGDSLSVQLRAAGKLGY